jgi:hypothetical protein
MAANIIIEPENIWDYFEENLDSLETIMHTVAENKEYGTEICLTNDGGLPCFVVTADDVEAETATCWEKTNCIFEAKRLYDWYLTDKAVQAIADALDTKEARKFSDVYDDEGFYDEYDYSTEDESLLMLEEEIDDRESDLRWAIGNFLETVLSDSNVSGDEYIEIEEDCLEHFLEYIHLKHGLDIYRPMWIKYEDGSEEFEEFPYENLAFDDEDNPIYAR